VQPSSRSAVGGIQCVCHALVSGPVSDVWVDLQGGPKKRYPDCSSVITSINVHRF